MEENKNQLLQKIIPNNVNHSQEQYKEEGNKHSSKYNLSLLFTIYT